MSEEAKKIENVELYVKEKRKRLKDHQSRWEILEVESPQKFLELIKSSFKPKISRGHSAPGQLSINMEIESNMDDANAYIEEVREEICSIRDGVLADIEETTPSIKLCDNNKDKLALIKLAKDNLHFLETAQFAIYKDNVVSFNCEGLQEGKDKLDALEEEIKDEEDAKRYGVEIKDLPNHRKYVEAKRKIPSAKTSASLFQVAKMFEAVKGYLDADEWADEFREKATAAKECEEFERKTAEYEKILELIEKAKTLKDYEKILSKFESVRGFMDADSKYQQCVKIRDRLVKEEEERKAEEERLRKEALYTEAVSLKESAKTSKEYEVVIEKLKEIEGYKNVDELLEESKDLKFEACLNEEVDNAEAKMAENTIEAYYEAIDILKQVADFRGAEAKIVECEKRIQEIKDAEEAERQRIEKERIEKENQKKRKKRNILIGVIVAIVIAVSIPLYTEVISPILKINKVEKLIKAKEYDSARGILFEMIDKGEGSYTERRDLLNISYYQEATDLFNEKKYEEAAHVYAVVDYEDSKTMEKECYYLLATDYFNAKDYENAINWFNEASRHKDAYDMKQESMYLLGIQYFETGKYHEGYDMLYSVRNYKDAKDQAFERYYQQGLTFYNVNDFEKSNEIFKVLKKQKYKDSALLIHEHQLVKEVIEPLTCETNGITRYTCECGYVNEEIKEALGHKYSTASCTQGEVCENCKHEKSSALGHTNEDGVCERCGYNSMKPMELSGSGSSVEKATIHKVSLPKGKYTVQIYANPDKKGSSYEMWTVKFNGKDMYFGYGASLKKGTFSMQLDCNEDITDGEISVFMKGSYRLNISAKN